MVLFVIGLGLADEQDVTLRGLKAMQGSERVYLEAYTSIFMADGAVDRLQTLIGKEVRLAHRETVELEADDILELASSSDVSFCVVGDPLSATTHTDLILRAKHRSPPIAVKVIHNASIMTALASSGLAAYNFGQTISVPFWTEAWKPDSWLERVGENVKVGLHTLCLGDIKVREQSEEDMARGVQRYQKPRYMLIPQLISQLTTADNEHGTAYIPADRTLAIALCRMGAEDELVVSGTLSELLALAQPADAETAKKEEEEDEQLADEQGWGEKELAKHRAKRAEERAVKAYGLPLHSLVLVGKRLHPLEREYAGMYKIPGSRWDEVAKEVYGCET
ncbi:diphthine synthase [Tilletia horrida]|uniref:diphthine methyl ester synthase n=1 Tax=Tilletia horrida TaxID=155126 RepID=A0AAN6GSV5_9BASI|nr:diphthine synthase [Tilletia horrida]KAK0554296.1 diphthine synthase [Tilletia horrida]KAK0563387.1 diphthine synthase [Tilletia horrida]